MSDAFKGFDLKKIKTGKNFRAGKDLPGRQGLDGAFRELKDPKYGIQATNLSKQEILKFQAVLEEKLKSKNEYSKGLDYYDRQDLIHRLEKMRLSGDISDEDERDFKEVIERLRAK